MKKHLTLFLVFLLLITASASSSCKSRKSQCDLNNQYNSKKLKKNKSGYGTRYDFKTKPVKKNYVIRNR